MSILYHQRTYVRGGSSTYSETLSFRTYYSNHRGWCCRNLIQHATRYGICLPRVGVFECTAALNPSVPAIHTIAPLCCQLSHSFSITTVNKPMMSTVGEVVDEGLGEEFEDTPWVPPTVKRASAGMWLGRQLFFPSTASQMRPSVC